MKYLVTGGAGFIGSHLCIALVEEGHQVWALDDLSKGKLENLDQVINNSNFKFIQASLSQYEILEKLIAKVDVIYHLAAIVGVKHYVEDPVKVIDVDVCDTSKLLELAYKYGKKVIFASTSEVYGKSGKVPFSEKDDRLYGPSTKERWCYAIAKSASEHLCLGYKRKGLPIVIVRYFNVYGPHADSSEYGGVATRFIEQILTGQPLTVHGDGTQSRCFTYIDDIIKGTLRAGSDPGAVGEIFNLGHRKETTVLELAKTIIQVSGLKGEIVFQPNAEFYGPSYEDIPRRIPDLTKAEEILEYKPTITLEEGLKKTIDWYKSQSF